MIRTLACLSVVTLAALAAAEDGKDYGIPNWSCDAEVMKKSKTKPKSVHSLRFADIDVIAALGDSLTAANGAGAAQNDAVAVLIQYRDPHPEPNTTIKIGTSCLKEHPEVDIENQWKLVHIFIGGNDMCDWCDYPDVVSDQHFRDNIGAAVQILKDNLPKTIVVLVGMLDLSLLRSIDKGKYFCDKLHTFECPCEQEFNHSDEDIRAECKKYMASEQELQDGRFDTTDDFTLVIQPFFEDINIPPLTPDGEPDLSFFAPDCFHFSAFGHAVVAKTLWNNIVQPVGMKDRWANLTDLSPPLACPDKACPFIRTTKNSDDCSKYMTPAA